MHVLDEKWPSPVARPPWSSGRAHQGEDLRPNSSYISGPRFPMISTSSLVLDGLGPAAPHHMGFGEHYMRSKMPSVPSEFLRPLPKPAPLVPRYNGRPASSQSPRKDFLPPSTTGPPVSGPVNLAKDAGEGPYYASRIFQHPGFFPPYGGLYPSPYPSMLTRPTYIPPTPLSPMDPQYPSAQTSPNSPAYRSPGGFSPQPPPPPMPTVTSTSASLSQVVAKPQTSVAQKRPFKVPPGREIKTKLVPQRVKRQNLNNNTLPPNFTKGSLIRLGNGELRRVEDVTMADLESSAEQCPTFRLDPSTVVRIEESANGIVLLTLSHGENKRTVDIESTVEHPYFIYGRGWASCSPQRTLTCYGLSCQRLQVGDVCVSLSPRQAIPEPAAGKAAVTSVATVASSNLPDATAEDKLNKRRRWSAPEPIDGEEEIIDPGSPSPVPKRLKE